MAPDSSIRAEPTLQPAVSERLWHLSLNDDAEETIVLLHGLGTCHAEWKLVWPHLTLYHLLIPDLNGHDKSKHTKPTTINAQVACIEDLIRDHAHDGKAHLVGMSMGGFTAIETAKLSPELVRSLFVTGCAPFDGWRLWMASHPGIITAAEGLTNLLPKWVTNRLNEAQWSAQGLTVPDEVRGVTNAPDVSRDVLSAIGQIKLEPLKGTKARVLAAAGGKMDNVEATRQQGAALKHGCADSRAVVVREAFHPWNLQFPELFAKGVQAWIEERDLPAEFEELS